MRVNLWYTTGRGWAVILDKMVLVYVCVLVCVYVCVWGCIYDCHERLFSLEVWCVCVCVCVCMCV